MTVGHWPVPTKKWEIFLILFASAFTKENLNELPAVTQRLKGRENEKLCSFTVTSDMVKIKLLKLKMNKAPGIDLFGTRLLLELAELISVTVAELLNV